LAKAIAEFGYEAKAVYDGNRAIEEAATFLPDMALIDIAMPGLDGYETVTRLRKQRGSAHIIMVAVTGWTGDEYKQRAYECGFDLYIAKPMSASTLKDLLALLDPALETTGQPTRSTADDEAIVDLVDWQPGLASE
jgi:CheY-like chemotaxis protein